MGPNKGSVVRPRRPNFRSSVSLQWADDLTTIVDALSGFWGHIINDVSCITCTPSVPSYLRRNFSTLSLTNGC